MEGTKQTVTNLSFLEYNKWFKVKGTLEGGGGTGLKTVSYNVDPLKSKACRGTW